MRSCPPSDLATVVAYLDEEFIHRRQRTLGLARRYPKAFAADARLMLCEAEREIASALAVRPITLQDPQHPWRGAMIGMVHTRPEWRSRGCASLLLRETAELLRNEGFDFAVLWSGQADFYSRLGWNVSDRSVLGTVAIDTGRQTHVPLADAVAPATVADRLEAMRARHGPMLLARTTMDYSSIPLPAENAFAVLHEHGSDEAYALFATCGAMTIVFEMAGTDASLQHLWEKIRGTSREIRVNEERGSRSYQWFSRNTDVKWEGKNLAAWLPLSNRLPSRLGNAPHIPFFDRI